MTSRNNSARRIKTLTSGFVRIYFVVFFLRFSGKAKAIFEDVKRIIFQIERAIRHKKVFCLGGQKILGVFVDNVIDIDNLFQDVIHQPGKP